MVYIIKFLSVRFPLVSQKKNYIISITSIKVDDGYVLNKSETSKETTSSFKKITYFKTTIIQYNTKYNFKKQYSIQRDVNTFVKLL